MKCENSTTEALISSPLQLVNESDNTSVNVNVFDDVHEYSSMLDYIQRNPLVSFYVEASGLYMQNRKLTWRLSLAFYLINHILFGCGSLAYFGLLLSCAFSYCSGGALDQTFNILQIIMVYLTIYVVRVAIRQPQRIEKSTAVKYTSNIEEIAEFVKYFVIIYSIFIILFSLLISVLLYDNAINAAVIIAYDFILFIPSAVLTGGIFGYILFEVRCLLDTIKYLYELVNNKMLFINDYYKSREESNKPYRDHVINLLVLAAIINIIGSGIIAWMATYYNLDYIVGIPVLVIAYGKQFVMLFIVLAKVLQVNTLSQSLSHQIATDLLLQCQNDKPDSLGQDDSTIELTNGDSIPMKKTTELERINLYMVITHFPIGCNVIYFQPTRTQVLFQMFSLVAVVLTIILRIFVTLLFK